MRNDEETFLQLHLLLEAPKNSWSMRDVNFLQVFLPARYLLIIITPPNLQVFKVIMARKSVMFWT